MNQIYPSSRNLTRDYDPSPKALLVIPLIGAFFIDVLNAAVIKTFIKVIAGLVS